MHPPLRWAGRQMVSLRTRAVQVCFEAGGFYRVRQSQLSEKLYAGTGQVLVKWSDYLLAVYNGEQRGGTAATVRYAKDSGRKIILIDPITRHITYLGISSEPVQS